MNKDEFLGVFVTIKGTKKRKRKPEFKTSMADRLNVQSDVPLTIASKLDQIKLYADNLTRTLDFVKVDSVDIFVHRVTDTTYKDGVTIRDQGLYPVYSEKIK